MAHSKSQQQLVNAAERQNMKNANTRLKMDGCVRLITHPAFAADILEAGEQRKEEERQKQARGELHDAWKKVQDAQQHKLKMWRDWKAQAKQNGEKFTEPAPKMIKKKDWVEKHWQGCVDDSAEPPEDDDVEDI